MALELTFNVALGVDLDAGLDVALGLALEAAERADGRRHRYPGSPGSRRSGYRVQGVL